MHACDKSIIINTQLTCQVNGDSGNDEELFHVPGVMGCVVANAHPELLSFADRNKENPLVFKVGLQIKDLMGSGYQDMALG